MHSVYVSLVLLLGLAGCTIAPPHPVSSVQVPASWGESPPVAGTERGAELARWWETFQDKTLDELIARGISANLDLREATARIAEARNLTIVAAANEWPLLGASASYTRSRSSSTTFSASSSSADEGEGTRSGSSFGFGDERDFYQTSLDLSWELDVFGRVRWSVKAAEADRAVAEEDRRGVMVSLLAEIARSYVELLVLYHRISIAK